MDSNQYKPISQPVQASSFEVIENIKTVLANASDKNMHVREDILKNKLDKLMMEIMHECLEQVYECKDLVFIDESGMVYREIPVKNESSYLVVTDDSLISVLTLLMQKYDKDKLFQLLNAEHKGDKTIDVIEKIAV